MPRARYGQARARTILETFNLLTLHRLDYTRAKQRDLQRASGEPVRRAALASRESPQSPPVRAIEARLPDKPTAGRS